VLIDSLPFHIAIGNPFIEQYRISEDMHNFDWTFTNDDKALLCMFRWSKGMSPVLKRTRHELNFYLFVLQNRN